MKSSIAGSVKTKNEIVEMEDGVGRAEGDRVQPHEDVLPLAGQG